MIAFVVWFTLYDLAVITIDVIIFSTFDSNEYQVGNSPLMTILFSLTLFSLATGGHLYRKIAYDFLSNIQSIMSSESKIIFAKKVKWLYDIRMYSYMIATSIIMIPTLCLGVHVDSYHLVGMLFFNAYGLYHLYIGTTSYNVYEFAQQELDCNLSHDVLTILQTQQRESSINKMKSAKLSFLLNYHIFGCICVLVVSWPFLLRKSIYVVLVLTASAHFFIIPFIMTVMPKRSRVKLTRQVIVSV